MTRRTQPRTREEPRSIVSGAFRLDAVLHRPVGAARGSIAISHPHPAHGGHMDHSVVRALAERAAAAGLAALRFDVRGVRASEGNVLDRVGHVEDVLAASTAAAAEAPGAPAFGAGFSYGARLWMAALPFAAATKITGLVLLAPPTRAPRTPRDFGDLLLGRPIRDVNIDPEAFPRLAGISVPTQILVGEKDNVAPPDELREHASSLCTVTALPGLNHFFSRGVGAAATDFDSLLPAIDAAFKAFGR